MMVFSLLDIVLSGREGIGCDGVGCDGGGCGALLHMESLLVELSVMVPEKCLEATMLMMMPISSKSSLVLSGLAGPSGPACSRLSPITVVITIYFDRR